MIDSGNFINLDDFISSEYTFYAHRKENGMKELLQEHIYRCEKYFMKIITTRGIDIAFYNIEEELLREYSKESMSLFYNMMQNVITFHDFGKMNPNFQMEKMDHKEKMESIEFLYHQSKHSMISAVWYLNYYYPHISNLSKHEQTRMMILLHMNAYIIAKHHSDLDSFERFVNNFDLDKEGYYVVNALISVSNKLNKSGFQLKQNIIFNNLKKVLTVMKDSNGENEKYSLSTTLYTYERLLYSILIASDYYATTEYMNDMEVTYFGEFTILQNFIVKYENNELYKGIREYQKSHRGEDREFKHIDSINVLRNEIFLEAEENLLKNIENNIFFLEAPTGSGKSNIALNLSMQLLKNDQKLQRIYYVYPFNTLVEQNVDTLTEIFGEELMRGVTIINSITPIKQEDLEEDNEEMYAKDMLNRQFLNYPFILTTSVSLFDTLFQCRQTSLFAFHQLANSIIVLDEIQSYRNCIWAEIITFLNRYAKILNIKVIIMSATLPNLGAFLSRSEGLINLIEKPDIYFEHPYFKERVQLNYELLNSDNVLIDLEDKVIHYAKLKKKILIEFISKKSASCFYEVLMDDKRLGNISCPIEYISGDDNVLERKRILRKIKSDTIKTTGCIVVATQVIEAGVDIDMEIGFKDISKLDSEEQFIGRINRSYRNKEQGIIYFFDYNEANRLYKEDVRSNAQFTVKNIEMRTILAEKNYRVYYEAIIEVVKKNYNNVKNQYNLDEFYYKDVANLEFVEVAERMKLIEEDKGLISVFLNRTIRADEGSLNGLQLWREYESLLKNHSYSFSKKKIELSKIYSKMQYFIYQIRPANGFTANGQIGELYFIENGEQFFENGKLQRDKLEKGSMFIDDYL